jgi:uncharacterized protein (TIGR03437 family)
MMKKQTAWLLFALPVLVYAQAGIITTVAGNGTIGFSGDGGAATSAKLGGRSTLGVAVDNSGNLLVVDAANNRIRSVNAAGIINTIAGDGPNGLSGNGGPATSATIFPLSAAVDGAGNLYISQGSVISQVNTSGIINAYAGSGLPGYSGDGGPALNAAIFCSGIAADKAGNLYIADGFNQRIRKVNTAGIITTIAGNGTEGFSGDGGPATSAELNFPSSVAVDSSGNVYFVDSFNSRVRKVSTSGTITTAVGNGSGFPSGNGGAATSAGIDPSTVAVDGSGNLYIADATFNQVRMVNTAGIITLVTGNGPLGFSGDGGPAANAQIFGPSGVAADSAGNIYIADSNNDRIRKVSSGAAAVSLTPTPAALSFSYTAGGAVPPSQTVTVIDLGVTLILSNSVSTTSGGNWLSVSPASVTETGGTTLTVSVSPAGLSANTYQGTVTVQPSGAGNSPLAIPVTLVVSGAGSSNIITTFAGGGITVGSGDGGLATSAVILGPVAVATDSSGNVYFAQTIPDTIRKVNTAGIISTYAGNGNDSYAGDGGPALSASFTDIQGLATDSAGNLYICDPGNARIREVSAAGTVSTFAGNGNLGLSGDGGLATSATLTNPGAVATDSMGNVFIADSSNNVVRKVNSGGIISEVAGGAPTVGYAGDGGPAIGAGMFLPYGVAEDSAGNIYIADVGDHRIRKVNSAGIISTFAGTGVSGYSGDGGPAISAKIGPVAHMGIAADSAGNVYFTDEGNNRVRMVNTAGIISTVAGNGLASFSGDGGPATAAGISNPVDLALDSAGNLYIVDYGNNRIRKVALGGGASGTPAISSNGVQNGASYQPGIAANSWVQIVGTNLSPVTDTWSNSIVSGNGNLPTSLDGVRVTIGGSPAYIEYVSSTQINVLAPNVSPGPVQVIVTTPSGTSSAFTVTASEYAPAFFPWPNNQVVATHSDYSYAVATGTFAGATTVAAKPGEVITLWGTGFGPTIPAAPPGIPVPSGVTYNTSTLPSVTINGVAATVYAAALTSGDAGLYQVAIQVPSSLANGTWPLVVGVGGVQSTAAMVLAVQQ